MPKRLFGRSPLVKHLLAGVMMLIITIILADAVFAQDEQPSSTLWQGTYWNNTDLSGAPALVQTAQQIDFDWGLGAPLGVNDDGFSARWVADVTLEAGTYRFTTTSDDGVRVWVNGQLLIDDWAVHPAHTISADLPVPAGTHNLVVEYFEGDGLASLSLNWSLVAGPTPTPAPAEPVAVYGDAAYVVDDNPPAWQINDRPENWLTALTGYGGQMHYTANNQNRTEPYRWVQWQPGELPTGHYEIFVYIPFEHATTQSALYWVRHGGGFTEVKVDQAGNRGEWISLGRYNFTLGINEYVTLYNLTGEMAGTTEVAADVLAFIRLSPELDPGWTVDPDPGLSVDLDDLLDALTRPTPIPRTIAPPRM